MGHSWGERLARRKPVEKLVGEVAGTKDDPDHLTRSITLFELTMFGVGATIGTGIFFVMTNNVPVAGPAVIVSFIIAGVAAGLTALCYAEMASMIPVSGSSYSYAYATLGEGVAFFVAACLILEYGISASAVAVGWSGYLNKFFELTFGGAFPAALSSAPLDADYTTYAITRSASGGVLNLPAAILVALCAMLLIRGSHESAKTNAIMVCIKIGVLAFFIVVALTAFNGEHFTPFWPHGWDGVKAAAGSIFFTYVGLDAVATAGEEVENPKRNLPLAIIGALIIVSTLYMLVAFAAIGAQPVADFEGQSAGLSTILELITGSRIPPIVVAIGAVISVFSVTLVVLYGQTRILFALSRDGLIPAIFHHVNPHTMSPTACTVIVAVIVAIIAAFVPENLLWDLVSLGTLVAFLVVSIGVMILRHRRPDMPRGFRVPFYPFLPILSILSCIYLIFSLNNLVFGIFAVWIVVAACFYLVYSGRHSRLEKQSEAAR
jgi:APA family basic amino acid/polyamine antiporter